jgi:hypothetical protein
MDNRKLKELAEVIQSSNINFLLGAGASRPYLPLLGDIESRLNAAKSKDEKIEYYKKYFKEVMLPNKKVLDNSTRRNANLKQTIGAYQEFFGTLSEMLIQRKSTILSKQVNVFTTNIDILIESAIENLQLMYNDGFLGRFQPIFSLANFRKSIMQRSLHFEHITESPMFNIIKMHGSLTWINKKDSDELTFSYTLEHLKDELLHKSGSEFEIEYKNILVVNPQESKHLESVLNFYYSELLRMYSSELEKENCSIFAIGFSFEDQHIREITLRAAKSNPTLRVFVCCSQKSKSEMIDKLQISNNDNIQILVRPEKDKMFTLEYMTKEILKKVFHN